MKQQTIEDIKMTFPVFYFIIIMLGAFTGIVYSFYSDFMNRCDNRFNGLDLSRCVEIVNDIWLLPVLLTVSCLIISISSLIIVSCVIHKKEKEGKA